MMRTAVSLSTYRNDPLYPRIERSVAVILQKGKVVAPVDLLIRMRLLTPDRIQDWRRGRVLHLETVINCNLSRLSKLLQILHVHAHDLKLVPSATGHMRWGKGPKKRLRFTKTGDPKLVEYKKERYPKDLRRILATEMRPEGSFRVHWSDPEKVVTTPYLLLKPDERAWQAYFRRTLPDAPLQERISRYEHHMKFGPTRNYWTDFVFEAYVNHRSDVIFLAGLPDVPESRPHSRVNSQ